MAVNIWVSFLLEPRDGQPSKYESISVHLSCFNTEHALICTHLSPMLTMLYHPISIPFSRSSSKPGVQIRQKRAHICSGLMFECPAFHWCWIVPASEGSRVWCIYVCTYAMLKFSVPRSLWVTHGAPMVVSVSFYRRKEWPHVPPNVLIALRYCAQTNFGFKFVHQTTSQRILPVKPSKPPCQCRPKCHHLLCWSMAQKWLTPAA